jgi:hypothetical protein
MLVVRRISNILISSECTLYSALQHRKNHVVSREENYPVQEMTVSYKFRIRKKTV